MAWLSGWSYRKSHVINYAAGAGTLYQKQITVHYGSGTDGDDDVYLNSHCRTDFGDVRFTDDDGTTLLDYWMESKVDSDNAVFWVEVADDLSTVNATIYVYYGKADATYPFGADQTQMDATFLFADHFYGTSLDTTKWGSWLSGTGTVADSYLKMDSASWNLIATKTFTAGNAATHAKFIRKARGIDYDVLFRLQDSSNFYQTYVTTTSGQQYHKLHKNVTGTFTQIGTQVAFIPSLDVAYVEQVCYYSSSLTAYIDGSYAINATNTAFASGKIGIKSYKEYWIDWIFTKKYVEPEPAHGTWGSEETPVVYKTVTEYLGGLDSYSHADKEIHRTKIDYIGALDTKSRTKQIHRIVTELLGALDVKSWVHRRYKTITELLGVLDSFTTKRFKMIQKTITEILGALDTKSQIKSLHKTISELLGTLDTKSRVKSIHRSIAEQLGMLDIKSRVKSYFRTFTELLGVLDTKSRVKIFRTIMEFLGALDVKSRVKSVFRTRTESLGMVDVISRAKSYFRSITEYLGELDILSRVKSIHRTVTELLGGLDTKSRIKSIHRIVTELLGTLDTYNRIKSILKKISVFAQTLLGKKKAYVLLKKLGARVLTKKETIKYEGIVKKDDEGT